VLLDSGPLSSNIKARLTPWDSTSSSRLMLPSPQLLSDATTNANPGAFLHLQGRVGSIDISFDGSWGSDSNDTASNLPGPGRPLGQLLSAAGRRLEAAVDRTAARAGLGFEGIARRLLMKLRAPHAGCHGWPDFVKTPIVELAVKLGHERCAGCNERYMSALSSTSNREVEELFLRLLPSIE
jgi:hypothetical protein